MEIQKNPKKREEVQFWFGWRRRDAGGGEDVGRIKLDGGGGFRVTGKGEDNEELEDGDGALADVRGNGDVDGAGVIGGEEMQAAEKMQGGLDWMETVDFESSAEVETTTNLKMTVMQEAMELELQEAKRCRRRRRCRGCSTGWRRWTPSRQRRR
ncbi:hypothetical protein U1Q18_015635 [Sarracenia purpurea var. burkii]